MFETPDLVSSRCLLVQHGADMVGRWGLGLCPLWAGCGWVTEPQGASLHCSWMARAAGSASTVSRRDGGLEAT